VVHFIGVVTAIAILGVNTGAAASCDFGPVQPRHSPYGAGIIKVMEALRNNSEAQNVIIGDSIANGFGNRNRNPLAPSGYTNLGAGGDTAGNVIWRIRTYLPAQVNYPNIVIIVGTNDLRARSADKVACGIQHVAAEMRRRSPQAKISIFEILPRGIRLAEFKEKIYRANLLVKQWVALQSDMYFLEVSNRFAELCENEEHCHLLKDDIHPNGVGYSLMSRALDR
jgi:lysophospholipase L1-like esterase